MLLNAIATTTLTADVTDATPMPGLMVTWILQHVSLSQTVGSRSCRGIELRLGCLYESSLT